MEPIFDKVEDFALEFYSDGRGKLLFVGYSRFVTDDKGAYRGNILTGSPEWVEEWIQQYVPFEAFVRIRNMMQKALETSYATSYMGFLGVDMMVCRDEGRASVCQPPCVEINLRMNMGIVSHVLRENFVAPVGRDVSPLIVFRPMMPCRKSSMSGYAKLSAGGEERQGCFRLSASGTGHSEEPLSGLCSIFCVTAAVRCMLRFRFRNGLWLSRQNIFGQSTGGWGHRYIPCLVLVVPGYSPDWRYLRDRYPNRRLRTSAAFRLSLSVAGCQLSFRRTFSGVSTVSPEGDVGATLSIHGMAGCRAGRYRSLLPAHRKALACCPSDISRGSVPGLPDHVRG